LQGARIGGRLGQLWRKLQHLETNITKGSHYFP
jgi:hypothetical protein